MNIQSEDKSIVEMVNNVIAHTIHYIIHVIKTIQYDYQPWSILLYELYS